MEQTNGNNAESTSAKTSRKKTPGACERCREKRIKCNGIQPCDQCTKREHNCTFDFQTSAANEVLAEKLDLVLKRLESLETSIYRGTDQKKDIFAEIRPRYVAQLNPQTGCFEYYGRTSTFMIAFSLGQKFQQLEEDGEVLLPRKRPRLDSAKTATSNGHPEQELETLGLSDLTGFSDYVVPSTALRQYRCLREDVADRHLGNFFQTIHIFLPIFDVDRFWVRYHTVRALFGESRLYVSDQENRNRQQFLCLLYAVLALGALYEDDRDDSSAWASWYFVEAQELLGRLLDAVNLELVQAAMLMGAYAQHAIKPNLAYNITGIAIRLALSIGLNAPSMYELSGIHAEEARRTWWLVYVQEVELSLDSGRPMSVQTPDMEIEYPTIERGDGSIIDDKLQVVFIRYLAEIAKIASTILKLMNSGKGRTISISSADIASLREHLHRWKTSLPAHLQFDEQNNEMEERVDRKVLCGWKARQRSSLRIHYNLIIIILHRTYFIESTSIARHDDMQVNARPHHLYRQSCVGAAQDMINHIHQLFKIAPNLRRWSYYCFYCLQATLILLTSLIDVDRTARRGSGAAIITQDDQMVAQGQTLTENELKEGCELSIEIFEQIELKAARKCAEVVRRFLRRWAARRRQALNSQWTNVTDANVRLSRHAELSSVTDAEYPRRPNVVLSQDDSSVRLQRLPSANLQSSRMPCTTNFQQHLHHLPSRMPLDGSHERQSFQTAGSLEDPSPGTAHSTTSLPASLLGGLHLELYDALHEDHNFGFYDPSFLFTGDGSLIGHPDANFRNF